MIGHWVHRHLSERSALYTKVQLDASCHAAKMNDSPLRRQTSRNRKGFKHPTSPLLRSRAIDRIGGFQRPS